MPPELWLKVIDILGKYGDLRSMHNLIVSLSFNPELGDNYRKEELIKERFVSEYDYRKQMLNFWKRTGIDDGVLPEDLLLHLNTNTRLFRTMWSYDIGDCDCGNKDTIYNTCMFYKTNISGYIDDITYRIVLDTRPLPKLIEKYCYGFSEKSLNSYTKLFS